MTRKQLLKSSITKFMSSYEWQRDFWGNERAADYFLIKADKAAGELARLDGWWN